MELHLQVYVIFETFCDTSRSILNMFNMPCTAKACKECVMQLVFQWKTQNTLRIIEGYQQAVPSQLWPERALQGILPDSMCKQCNRSRTWPPASYCILYKKQSLACFVRTLYTGIPHANFVGVYRDGCRVLLHPQRQKDEKRDWQKVPFWVRMMIMMNQQKHTEVGDQRTLPVTAHTWFKADRSRGDTFADTQGRFNCQGIGVCAMVWSGMPKHSLATTSSMRNAKRSRTAFSSDDDGDLHMADKTDMLILQATSSSLQILHCDINNEGRTTSMSVTESAPLDVYDIHIWEPIYW